MNFKKRQEGSALLVTLGLVLIFTVLGLSLLSLSISGTGRNEIREDTVASHDLAQKGADYLVSKIEYEISDALGEKGLKASDYLKHLEGTLKKYDCDANNNPDSSQKVRTGEMNYCILDYSDKKDITNKVNPNRKVVIIKSVGLSGEKSKQIVQDVEIGVDSIPDLFNYVLSTNKQQDGTGSGNLYLHGGLEIQGDMKVEGNLITYNKGYGNEGWVKSAYPRVHAYDNNTPKIVLKGSAYKLINDIDKNVHLSQTNFNNRNYEQHFKDNKLDMTKYFNDGYAPELVNRNYTSTKIAIEDYGKIMQYAPESDNQHFISTPDPSLKKIFINNRIDSDKKVYFSSRELVPTKNCKHLIFNCEYHTFLNPNIHFSGRNSFNSLSTEGNVYLERISLLQNNSLSLVKNHAGNGGTAYIGGNLTIGDELFNWDDLRFDDVPVELTGTYYVNGNLNIIGAELKANAIIYVNGSVKIESSSIQGINLSNNKTGSLIIFSNSNINLSKISPYDWSKKSTEIPAFFHTNENFEMGTVSKIFLKGGISAGQIALHGVRGEVYPIGGGRPFEFKDRYNDYGDEVRSFTQAPRLKVMYNPDIISTYSDLRQQEPIIYQIDPSKIIDKK